MVFLEIPNVPKGMVFAEQVTFELRLCNHFLKHAVRERPLLLLLDGHSTHYQLEVIQYARQNGV